MNHCQSLLLPAPAPAPLPVPLPPLPPLLLVGPFALCQAQNQLSHHHDQLPYVRQPLQHSLNTSLLQIMILISFFFYSLQPLTSMFFTVDGPVRSQSRGAPTIAFLLNLFTFVYGQALSLFLSLSLFLFLSLCLLSLIKIVSSLTKKRKGRSFDII